MNRWTTCMLCLGFMALLGQACGDDIQGHVRLMVVPVHEGRNPTQDPFSLVDSVELGLTGNDASYRKIGDWSPLPSFGPGLLGQQGLGAFTLTGLNAKGRSIARGFGPFFSVVKGVERYVNIPFARIDYTFATRLRPSERALPDPYQSAAPSFILDATNLEQGQRDGDHDSGCLVWVLWDSEELWIKALVRDDSLNPSGVGPVADGDAVVVYLDKDSDGEVGDPDDLVISLGADGRIEPEGLARGVDVETVAGGYLFEFRLPLTGVMKNQILGFDFRQVDIDEGDSAPSYLTWKFDPRKQGQNLEPADYGGLVLGVETLSALEEPGSEAVFSGPDGNVDISSWWDGEALHFLIQVQDDKTQTTGEGNDMDGADVIEVILDLNNAGPPVEERRFFKIAVSAGGSHTHEAGPDLENMTELGVAFSGEVDATIVDGGYRVELSIPWQDLELDEEPQRGWFLGAEINVIDRDGIEENIYAWSDSSKSPEVWNELRLFGLQ